MIGGALPGIVSFSEEQSAERRDRIFEEFNSLAVVYRAPSSAFVAEGDAQEYDAESVAAAAATEESALLGEEASEAESASHGECWF